MDIDKLRKTYPKLIAYMKTKGMHKNSYMDTERMIKKILSHEGEFSSYADYYQKYIDKDGLRAANPKFSHIRALIYRIWAFDEYDHYPNGFKFKPIIHPDTHYQALNDFFRSIVDKIVENEEVKMLAKQTITIERNMIIKFFLNALKKGASDFNNMTPEMITSFFVKDGRIIRGNSIASKINKLLRPFAESFPIINMLMKYIVKRRDVVTLTEIISDEEVKKAKELVNTSDSSNDICLRDKAVVATALYTGMRGSDIANLTLDSIDWGNDRINIIQSKTQQRLTLPLPPSLGNIIYDYIVNERPKDTDSRQLFFNSVDQSKGLVASNVTAITHAFMGKLCDEKYSSKGLRALRHRLASKLLETGTEPAVISSILGHVEPTTINKYLDMDIENLRSCSLDISMFPVDEEVYR